MDESLVHCQLLPTPFADNLLEVERAREVKTTLNVQTNPAEFYRLTVSTYSLFHISLVITTKLCSQTSKVLLLKCVLCLKWHEQVNQLHPWLSRPIV